MAIAGPQGVPLGRPAGEGWNGAKAAKLREVIAAGRARHAKFPGSCAQNAASSAGPSRAATKPASASAARAAERLSASRLWLRSEEHTSELQSLMRISYAVFCLQKKQNNDRQHNHTEKHTKHTDKNQ